MNWIKKIFGGRKERKQLRRLKEFRQVFGTLDRLEHSGLLWYDTKHQRLFMEQPLALVMMRGGAEKWKTFLQNCCLWQYGRECRRAWDEYIRNEELKAVRVAMKAGAEAQPPYTLSRRDVERVKRARRDEIALSDMEPPKVEGFEFFVIREDLAGKPQDAVRAAGVWIAVGHYEPGTEFVEMATYEDVKRFLIK